MSSPEGRKRKVAASIGVVVLLALTVIAAASCGSGNSKSTSSTTNKLPPEVSEKEATRSSSDSTAQSSAESSTDSSTGESSSSSKSGNYASTSSGSTPDAFAVLNGAKFTVTRATRPDSNSSVVSSGGREVKGDFFEIAMTVENAATDHMVDLSKYSFRLYSPGIQASTYESYYGETGTYGKYVDEHEVSASLLSYSTLEQVSYLLKVGESVDEVFLFFDLNPENVGRNPNVTKDNSAIIIKKTSGDEYGTEVTIPLAGYQD